MANKLTPPAFATDENVRFNGILDKSIVLRDSGGTKDILVWDDMDIFDQTNVENLLNRYGVITLGTAGKQVANYSGTVVGGNPTGLLNDATVFTATINVDGSNNSISVVGSAAQTYTDLVNEINADLGASATATINGTQIDIVSATTGDTSDVTIVDNNLLSNTNNYNSLSKPLAGVNDTTDVFKRNLHGNGNDYFRHLYNLIKFEVGTAPDKPASPQNKNLVYFDGSDWRHLYDDSIV